MNWYQGNGPQNVEYPCCQLSSINGCGLTRMAGHFAGAGESVSLPFLGSWGCYLWQLSGTSQQTDVAAAARCVGNPLYSD